METKICTNCKEEKFISEFHKRSDLKFGVNYECKVCACFKKRAALAIKNKEKNSPEKKLERELGIKAKVRESQKKWVHLQMKTNPIFKLKKNLRGRITNVLKQNFWHKDNKTKDILGADIAIVKCYLEKQFKKDMNWGNYGKGKGRWQIDHKIPLASAKTEEDLKILCHYTNLQPMWSEENLKKRDKILLTQTTLTI